MSQENVEVVRELAEAWEEGRPGRVGSPIWDPRRPSCIRCVL